MNCKIVNKNFINLNLIYKIQIMIYRNRFLNIKYGNIKYNKLMMKKYKNNLRYNKNQKKNKNKLDKIRFHLKIINNKDI